MPERVVRGDGIQSTRSTYLNDHRAAAAAGVRLARGIAERNTNSRWAPALDQLARQVCDDVDTLDRIRRHLGVTPGRLKRVLAVFGGKLARIKFASSERALAMLMELETLASGISGKRVLWIALREADLNLLLPDIDLIALQHSAQAQLELLEPVHRDVAAQVLAR